VEDYGGVIVGMIAVVHDGDEAGEVRRLAVDPRWRHTPLIDRLLRVAVDHCRRQGFLKIVVDSYADPHEVIRLLDGRGLWCSRQRAMRTRDVVEFYIDLYQRWQQERDGDARDDAVGGPSRE